MKKWLVAYSEGGTLNLNEVKYKWCHVIEAVNQREAVKQYEQIYNCSSVFLVCCLGEYNENTGMVQVPISIFIDE